MKYKLNVNNQSYEVEIENINARPVVVTVDGQRFEVMPEAGNQAQVKPEADVKVATKSVAQSPTAAVNLPGSGIPSAHLCREPSLSYLSKMATLWRQDRWCW
ncbi:MAG: hypothetical protein IPJ47_02945 [Anaerolineales bacterium]|nr:hypothetical protein [Anaerolineales bacterium]